MGLTGGTVYIGGAYAWCRAMHGQERSQEQVDQNGVL